MSFSIAIIRILAVSHHEVVITVAITYSRSTIKKLQLLEYVIHWKRKDTHLHQKPSFLMQVGQNEACPTDIQSVLGTDCFSA